ncbi:MAG: hypothetical protein FRX48_03093 [Lasallia pustulata]|uniref:Uncharacterized protein n=1 Tax=Lasallia pustulata TaxID=136370 RepID=A0A5M8PWK9_9LECA|nr:MAG: hypothetical protein FRX48_03093 [Lasallia pustulata]
MPYHDSPSPAKRPSLVDRTSSSQSVSRASPSGMAPSTSHKTSTHKLVKAHAVGHNRLPHTRVPSYGKGLHKLTKIDADAGAVVTAQSRSKAHTESTSPLPHQSFKRNSSTGALPRTKSKASVKKNSSELFLKRNGSAAHLGKAVRLDSTARAARALNGKPKKAKFSVGSEGHDDDQEGEEEEEEEWTEDTNSHSSPATTRNHTRQNSLGPNHSRPRTPPTVEGGTDRPYAHTSNEPPHTPSESPSHSSNASSNHRRQSSHTAHHFPDADALTNRLLQRRSSHNLAPQMSSVSATATPTGTHSPHSTTQSHNEPSMPSDGISRFLSNGGSSSGSATPGSLTQLPSTLSHLRTYPPHQIHQPPHHHPPLSASPPPPNPAPAPLAPTHPSYPSALDRKDPSLPSRTQFKLELQRQQSKVSNAQPHAPAVQNGVDRGGGGGGGGGGGEDRMQRAWDGVLGEMANCRRFRNPVLEAVGRVGGGGRGGGEGEG